jgi:DDE superfamily endonuclease
MNILNQILTHVGIRKTQTTFLTTLFAIWLAIPGRINYANLDRFSSLNEKTYRNWFAKPIPWIALNVSLVEILQSQQRMGSTLILGIDASNSRKAGKHTHGVAKFWDSKLGKAVSSLEISCCTLIDLEHRQAIPIHALQTPARLPEEESRVTHYAEHLETTHKSLPEMIKKQIKCVVGDAFYSKKAFIDKVVNSGLCFVGKLRTDANLRMLSSAPRSKKAGRPKRYAGKVDWDDLSAWKLEQCDEHCTVHSARVNSPSLKRDLRVVCITWFVAEGKTRREVLFSTDTQMSALEIVECYRARFEMEFPFRDAKQFAGLMDCQSRQEKALGFHWNASFLVTSLTRAQQLLDFDGDMQDFVFRMEDSKRRAYNELFAERIIRMLPLDLSFEKCLLLLEDALNLGVKAA